MSNPQAPAQLAKAGASASLEAAHISSLEELERIAKTLRRDIVTMIGRAASGHPGGSLSTVEILTSLFFNVMRHRPSEPKWPDRDRFILSKGHGAPALYSALAETGYFPMEWLSTLRRLGSPLQGHPDMNRVPGVEFSTGSLGQGLSVATGMALAARMDKRDYRVYALLSDGECQEGQTWEAAMFAGHHELDNLTVMVDANGCQLDGFICSILDLDPLPAKWKAFGWHTLEVDGHSISELLAALEEARSTKGVPTAIIAHTIKGKGVSFMENNNEFHGKAPSPEQVARALEELA
ncbi:MAG: transketolase [Dehalococcoidia bacterium]|nr:transketolase [Dehalococcoidia bacterium]